MYYIVKGYIAMYCNIVIVIHYTVMFVLFRNVIHRNAPYSNVPYCNVLLYYIVIYLYSVIYMTV